MDFLDSPIRVLVTTAGAYGYIDPRDQPDYEVSGDGPFFRVRFDDGRLLLVHDDELKVIS